MSVNIEMPKLSDTMIEGTLVKWHKQIGDTVEIGDILADIETDKATMEMEAFDDGIITDILINSGEKALIGTVLAVLNGNTDTSSINSIPSPPADKSVILEPARIVTSMPEEDTQGLSQVSSPQGRNPSSPLARKIAAELGVDISHLTGTGPGGRITRSDVESAVIDTNKPKPVAITPSNEAIAAAALVTSIKTKAPSSSEPLPAPDIVSITIPKAIQPVAKVEDEIIELSSMRKIIASRLLTSKTTIPHFYLHIEVDAQPLITLRNQINEQTEHTHGNKYSINDFILKAVINATQAVPAINASFAGDHIVKFQNIGLCIAVAIDDGLVTPVIKDADSKSLLAISRAVKDFATRAKDRKLRPDEFDGGTITVSSLGAWGIESFDAIVNPPQAAILSVGAIIEKPVVKNGEIVPGLRMNLGLSCDHRVIDGAVGARFLSEIRKFIEQPALMLL